MPARDDLRNGFRLGGFEVMPERNLVRAEDGDSSLERLAMDVLVELAMVQGELVTKDDLVDSVWDGRPQMDDVITQKISLIRKALGDQSKPHQYVETIFGRGYRLKMPIELLQPAEPVASRAPPPWYLSAWSFGFLALLIVIGLVFMKPTREPGDGEPMRSVVIFPFQCSQSDDDYLCDGFSGSLTGTLAQMDDLKVVKSRTPYPDQLTEPEIAEQFGVDGVILGVVSRLGGTLTVSADLVDGRSGFLVFSNVYNTAADMLLDTQEQVANDVRTSIRGTQSPELRTASRPANYDVLERFWRAEYEFAKRTPESLLDAISLYKEAIDLDERYGPAYLRLAYATALLPDYNEDDARDEMYDLALQIAAEGIEMDASIAAPAATLFGFVYHKRGDWIGAQAEYDSALSGDVVFPQTHQLYSRLLASVGRLDASLEQAKLARALDPQNAVLISRLAISYYWLGEDENARYLFELIEDRPDLGLPINDLAYAFLLLREKNVEKSVKVATAGLKNWGNEDGWVQDIFRALQDPEAIPAAVQRIQELEEMGAVRPVVQITLWTLFGQIEKAMGVARRLESEGEIFEAEILFTSEFDRLREHPDFFPLMQRIGLADYWASEECTWDNYNVVCPETPQE